MFREHEKMKIFVFVFHLANGNSIKYTHVHVYNYITHLYQAAQAHETEFRNVLINEFSIKITSFFQCIEEPMPIALFPQLTPKGPNLLIGRPTDVNRAVAILS